MDEEWRKKISTSKILARLNLHATEKDEKMTPSQIKAAEILLRKVLPDLKMIELTGEGGGPIQHRVKVTFVRPDGNPNPGSL
jgi:hypothetical protein